MHKAISKYGLAAHLALLAVAPLFLYPFCGDVWTARAVIWLSLIAAAWTVLEPSRRADETLHDARFRVASSIALDPLFWFSIVLVLIAAVRWLNGGIGMVYDAEKSVWSLSEARIPFLPGATDDSGYLPFAAVVGVAVLIQAGRHALGKSARVCFLFVAALLSGLAAVVAGLACVFENPVALRYATCSTVDATYPGVAFGLCFMGSMVAIAGAFEAWKENDSALIVLPTGLGKTVVFSEIVRQFQPTRALVVAHREELIFQAAETIKKVTGLDGGIEMGEYHADGGFFGTLPPYVVTTVQTQCSGGDGGGRMTKFLPQDFGLVVIDEAHHATANTYKRVIDYYRQNTKCKILGVTATPDRADEEALGQVFDTVAYEYQILDAINQGWLVPVQQQTVTVETMDFSNIRTTAGDLNQGELAEVMEEEDNLQRVAVPTVEICGERRAIVFAATVKQAERLAEIMNRYRPD